MRWKISTALLVMAGTLCGCSNFQETFEGRYGPSPYPIAIAVEAATARELAVVRAIARGSGFSEERAPASREDWYNVILTGFNTVDDACIRYIDDLWILERRKTRNSTILHVTGAAVAAIIGANPNPSAATLTILAQGFGLAGALNNAIADSYLYSQSASTIKTLVRKTTTVYRNDLAAKVLNKTEIEYPLGSAAAAYFHMREYLALCLPPSIQEQIDTLVTKAKAGVEEPPTAPPVARALIVRSTGASRATTPVGF